MSKIQLMINALQKQCFCQRLRFYMLSWNEPAHEIMVLFILRKLILQTRTCSHPVRLVVWFLVGPFVYFHASCVRTVMALARLRRCAGSPEPLLVAYVISTIISWAGWNVKYYLADYFISSAFTLPLILFSCSSSKKYTKQGSRLSKWKFNII